MPGPYWRIISWCWVVFVVYWGISARRIHAPKRQASVIFTIADTLMLYAGFVLALVGRFDVGPLASHLTDGTVYAQIGGTALVIGGVGLAIWSRYVLGANWSGTVRILEGQHLVRTGPYAVVRNPIYSGMALLVLGTAVARGTLGALVGFVLVLAALWLKGRVEERFLLAEFGDEYAAYRRDVKSLVPFVV